MEQVIEAAKIANAHDFIMASENGYDDTMIGDRGGKLSGGHGNVSALPGNPENPPILILDEATSALDTESERMVRDALEKLMKTEQPLPLHTGCPPSAMQMPNLRFLGTKKDVLERGKARDLLAMDGYYKKLCDMQQMS